MGPFDMKNKNKKYLELMVNLKFESLDSEHYGKVKRDFRIYKQNNG